MSISGSVVYLESAPIMFKSATQKHVALSVTEAELYAGVSITAQEMLCQKCLGVNGIQGAAAHRFENRQPGSSTFGQQLVSRRKDKAH